MIGSIGTKRALIDKANVTVVVAVSIATFVTMFSLVSCKALLSQRAYQSRVIQAQEKARDQLLENVQNVEALNKSYEVFAQENPNVIGGSSSGSGERDGDNPRIVLDALPSKYDFPALTTSLEKLIKAEGLGITSITGTDDEVAQQGVPASNEPQPVEIPFKVGVLGNYDAVQKLLLVFEHSIRPFKINQLEFKASESGALTVDISADSYYQPERGFEFKTEVVK